MKPWEKYLRETRQELMDALMRESQNAVHTAVIGNGYSIGFNDATEYWQGHIEKLVEALERAKASIESYQPIRNDGPISHIVYDGRDEIDDAVEDYRKATEEEE